MGIFPAYFNRYKLTVDEVYLISNGSKIKEARFVHSTPRGFNFLDLKTQKELFKKQLYSIEIVRDGINEYSFWFPKYIVISKK